MKYPMIASAVVLIAASATASAGGAEKDAKAASNAKLTLTEAIHTAEKANGGKAVDAEVEGGKGGHPFYTVEVLSSDGKKLTEYQVNANSGKIEKTENEPLEKLVTRVKPDDLQSTATTLTAAIREAEQQTGGKVIDAETGASDGALHYELKVATADGKTDKVKVDGATGKMRTK
jgi:uncharacterized membrane protein YkoI